MSIPFLIPLILFISLIDHMLNLVRIVVRTFKLSLSIHWRLSRRKVQLCKNLLLFLFANSSVLLTMRHHWLQNYFFILSLLSTLWFRSFSLNPTCCFLPVQSVKYLSNHLLLFIIFLFLFFALSRLCLVFLWITFANRWIFVVMGGLYLGALRDLFRFDIFINFRAQISFF